MVVRSQRLIRFFRLIAFYCVIGGLVYYFVEQAHSGNRSVDAKNALNQQVIALQEELAGLKDERAELERRLTLMKSDQIDRDLLEERARVVLGYVHPNDVVVMFDTP